MASYYAAASLLVVRSLTQAPPIPAYATMTGSTNGTKTIIPSTITPTINSNSSLISCPVACRMISYADYSDQLYWKRINITATETHATVLALIDQYNHTSYSTKYNTNLTIPLPENTNSEGTVTYATTVYDHAQSKNVSKTVTYPDLLVDYDKSLNWSGTLPTTYPNGASSCLIHAPSGTADPFPSHPFVPIITGTADSQDPRGWLYYANFHEGWNFDIVSSLFPDFAPLHSCATPSQGALPQAIVNGASFTTITSTSRVIALSSVLPAPSPPSPPSATLPVASAQNNNPVSAAQPIPSLSIVPPATLPSQDTLPAATHPSAGVGLDDSLLPNPPQTIARTPISVANSNLVISGSNPTAQTSFATPSAGYSVVNGVAQIAQSPSLRPAFTFAGATITANSQGGYIVGTQTLAAGAPAVTVSGTPVSIAPGGTAAVIAGSTQALQQNPARAFSFGSSLVTANAQGNFLVDGRTIVPGGPAVTVDGSTVSVAPGGTAGVVNGVTQSMAGVSGSRSGLGDSLSRNGSATAATTGATAIYTGKANRVDVRSPWLGVAVHILGLMLT